MDRQPVRPGSGQHRGEDLFLSVRAPVDIFEYLLWDPGIWLHLIFDCQLKYLLKYPSSSITVASIIQALEGTYYLDDEETKTEESAAGIAETIQEDIVDRVNHGLDQILQNLTLADLEESFQERQSGGQEMYYI